MELVVGVPIPSGPTVGDFWVHGGAEEEVGPRGEDVYVAGLEVLLAEGLSGGTGEETMM